MFSYRFLMIFTFSDSLRAAMAVVVSGGPEPPQEALDMIYQSDLKRACRYRKKQSDDKSEKSKTVIEANTLTRRGPGEFSLIFQ